MADYYLRVTGDGAQTLASGRDHSFGTFSRVKAFNDLVLYSFYPKSKEQHPDFKEFKTNKEALEAALKQLRKDGLTAKVIDLEKRVRIA